MVVSNQDLDLRYTWIYNLGLGYHSDEVTGKLDSEIFDRAEDAAVTEAMKEEVISTGMGRRKEVTVHSKGVDRCFDLVGEPLRDGDGRIAGVTCAALDIRERKQADEDLRHSEKLDMQRKQLQALAARLQRAREEERKKIARDLHDQIGQILTAIKMEMTWAIRHLPDAQRMVRDRIACSVELINEGVRSVRSICSGLRPGILDDLGLVAAIEWHGNEFASRTGISFNGNLPARELQLDSERATAIFRIFQESLTNVARHAEATSICTTLFEDNDELVLTVKDDGKGFCEPEAGTSLGLLGMKERAQACGGDVQVSSSPGQGTTVSVRIPLRAADADPEDHADTDSR
jgi:PAS domain S-box-containing protein